MKKNVLFSPLFLYNLALITHDVIMSVNPSIDSEDYRISRVEMCSRARSHMISSGDNKRNQTYFLCLEEKTQREKVVDSLIFPKD